MWNQTPRMPWQSIEYYQQEEAVLVPSEFERVHRNQWASPEEAFIQPEVWAACQAKPGEIPAYNKESVILALDAAVSGDCFGMLIVGGLGNGIYCNRFARRWIPPKGGKVNFGEVFDTVLWALDEFHVVEVCYDPYQLEDMAERISNLMIAHVHPFNQGAPRLIADKSLWDKIRDRRFIHDGNADLTEHILNANAKNEGDNKLRIIKRSEHLKIDLAVALSMAVERAAFWQL